MNTNMYNIYYGGDQGHYEKIMQHKARDREITKEHKSVLLATCKQRQGSVSEKATPVAVEKPKPSIFERETFIPKQETRMSRKEAVKLAEPVLVEEPVKKRKSLFEEFRKNASIFKTNSMEI